MEATALIQAIEQLRQTYTEPPSHMEIVRHSVMSQLARISNVEIPPLLSDEQRQIFIANIDLVADFLRSEDGADSIELVVDSFSQFVKKSAQPKPETTI